MKKVILPAEIHVALQPSQLLLGWMGLFSILVLLSVWWSLSLLWALPACLVLAIWMTAQIRRHVLLCEPQSWRQLRVDVYGRMFAQDNRQQWHAVEVLPHSVVHPRLMVLHFKLAEKISLRAWWLTLFGGQVMLIVPDQVVSNQGETDDLRRLRVWLRWGLNLKSADAQAVKRFACFLIAVVATKVGSQFL